MFTRGHPVRQWKRQPLRQDAAGAHHSPCPDTALHRTHRMGPEPGGAGAQLPAHRVRRGRGAAVRGDRRPRLGEHAMVGVLRVRVEHRAVDPCRERRHRTATPGVDQPRPDDVLLPGRRPRGAARVRPRSVAGAAPDPARRSDGLRRHGGGGAHLPGVQRRRRRRAWLGRGHVERYGVRARRARSHRPESDPPAAAPAVDLGGRRPRRAARDRHRLHGGGRRRRTRRRGRSVRRAAGAPVRARGMALAGRGGSRRRRLGRAAQVRSRPADLRARGGPGDRRVSAGANGAGARHRAGPLVPGAADAGAGALRPARRDLRDLGERTTRVPPAPLDELRDRAAVRAVEQRDPRGGGAARRRGHVADHAGDRVRVPGRKAGRVPARRRCWGGGCWACSRR